MRKKEAKSALDDHHQEVENKYVISEKNKIQKNNNEAKYFKKSADIYYKRAYRLPGKGIGGGLKAFFPDSIPKDTEEYYYDRKFRSLINKAIDASAYNPDSVRVVNTGSTGRGTNIDIWNFDFTAIFETNEERYKK